MQPRYAVKILHRERQRAAEKDLEPRMSTKKARIHAGYGLSSSE
jgi:hypothetical protein